MTETIRDGIAEAMHNSKLGVLRWDSLPPSDRNPQRYYARQAADAILAEFTVTRRSDDHAELITATLNVAAQIAENDSIPWPDGEDSPTDGWTVDDATGFAGQRIAAAIRACSAKTIAEITEALKKATK